jgi:hypothetical protein
VVGIRYLAAKTSTFVVMAFPAENIAVLDSLLSFCFWKFDHNNPMSKFIFGEN